MKADEAHFTLKNLREKHEEILAQQRYSKSFKELSYKQQRVLSWLAIFDAEEELNNIMRRDY